MSAENAGAFFCPCIAYLFPWHCLSLKSIHPSEAIGVETVLAGLRQHDDQLLASASAVFDSLLAAFEKGVSSE